MDCLLRGFKYKNYYIGQTILFNFKNRFLVLKIFLKKLYTFLLILRCIGRREESS